MNEIYNSYSEITICGDDEIQIGNLTTRAEWIKYGYEDFVEEGKDTSSSEDLDYMLFIPISDELVFNSPTSLKIGDGPLVNNLNIIDVKEHPDKIILTLSKRLS